MSGFAPNRRMLKRGHDAAELGQSLETADRGIARLGLTPQIVENILAVVGAHRMVRALVPGMLERQRGDIVFLSSDVAVRARPFMGAYTAAKWGLEGLASSLQMELEGTGVRASIVRPGPTKSEMGSDWGGPAAETVITKWVEHGLARHPLLLRASAIADAILTVVTAPRGVHVNAIEVSPEAPLEDL